MDAIPPIDAGLLRRYERPHGRDPLCLIAPLLDARFDEAQLRSEISRSNADPIPRELSLYVHVPYCFRPRLCCFGAQVISSRSHGRGSPYVERLVREIGLLGRLFDRDRDVVQLHLGGGSTNFISSPDMSALMDSLEHQFHFGPDIRREFLIELDPQFLEPGEVQAYADLGFNQVSLGVQEFDPVVQRAVNHAQSAEQMLRAFDACRDSSFRSVNVDLLYGRSGQTPAGFARTLDTVLAARPDRLTVYNYSRLPEASRAQNHGDTAQSPDAELKLELLRLALDRLSAAGYRHIGMEHFALPEDSLARAQTAGKLQRSFAGYTTHARCDLIGLGVSAISHIGDSFSQNLRDLPAWERTLDEGRLALWRGAVLDEGEILRSEILQELICRGEIDVAGIECRHDIDFAEYFAATLTELRPLVAGGLVTIEPGRIAATSRGRLFMRIIAMCFENKP